MMHTKPTSTYRVKLGYILIAFSILSYLLMFATPFVVQQDALWISGVLYFISHIFWVAAIPILGKKWFVEQKAFWTSKIQTWRMH